MEKNDAIQWARNKVVRICKQSRVFISPQHYCGLSFIGYLLKIDSDKDIACLYDVLDF